MPTVHGFAALAARDAEILILGTMPGKASLRAGEYYAHSRNAFWSLLAEIIGFDDGLGYAERVTQLARARIAVWDVLQRCTRESSLDSDIVDDVPNDFAAFFAAHPRISRVCFNGSAARAKFDRFVLPMLSTFGPARSFEWIALPSTSPAHAVPRAVKLAPWKAALDLSRGHRR